MTLHNDQLLIRAEIDADIAAIHAVHARAFGQEDEAKLVDALRAGGFVVLSLVAVEQNEIVGHVLLSRLPLHTGEGIVPLLSLAPVGVWPEYQRRGIGSALIREAIRQAKGMGERAIVVLGHADYYPRFGFDSQLARRLRSAFSGDEWMAMELVPGALLGLEGEVRYPAPFGC
ncbi:MAG: N-acetyltransferase [Planctomycetales bacterium]